MKRIVLKRNIGRKPTYNITHFYEDETRSRYCKIKHKLIRDIKDHSLIIAHHPLGGGSGGWDSYDENLKVVHSNKEYGEEVPKVARQYAKGLAKKIGIKFVDLTK